jgi:hypothetical protein
VAKHGTSHRYQLTASDVGHTVRVQETASNASGSATATSAPTRVVTGAGALSLSRIRIGHQAVTVLLVCPAKPRLTCSGTLTLIVRETVRTGKVIAVVAADAAGKTGRGTTRRTVTLGSAKVRLLAGGRRTVILSLNRTGKRLLASRLRLAVRLSLSRPSQAPVGRTVTFKRTRT